MLLPGAREARARGRSATRPRNQQVCGRCWKESAQQLGNPTPGTGGARDPSNPAGKSTLLGRRGASPDQAGWIGAATHT
eukprot:5631315-Lingulodinium_polyedra.AAC.1